MDPPPHKKIKISIVVKIRRADTGTTVLLLRQCAGGGFRETALAIIEIKPVLIEHRSGGGFHASTDDIQILVAIAVGIERALPCPHCRIGIEGSGRLFRETWFAGFVRPMVEDKPSRTAGGTSLEEVKVAIPIHIGPGLPRPLTRQPVGQEGLHREVIESAFLVGHRQGITGTE